jgi:rare lipoprotein A
MLKRIIGLFIVFLLGGCVSHKDAFTISGSKYRGHYKIGKTYKVNNLKYRPREVRGVYDETGFASWYGPGFYGKETANGEIFTGRDFTAAHGTLPLPSIIRVVNLENNKSIIVRVNDRGPFRGGRERILDLSEHAADVLGFKNKGVARVRVKFLTNETRLLHNKLGIVKLNGLMSSIGTSNTNLVLDKSKNILRRPSK